MLFRATFAILFRNFCYSLIPQEVVYKIHVNPCTHHGRSKSMNTSFVLFLGCLVFFLKIRFLKFPIFQEIVYLRHMNGIPFKVRYQISDLRLRHITLHVFKNQTSIVITFLDLSRLIKLVIFTFPF